MSERPSIRSLTGQDRSVWIMGAHDVLSAKIVEEAGFDAVGLQSLQLSLVNGLPDIGVMTPDSLVELCHRVRRAISIPIVVDFEQGFGDPYAAVYWMHELEAAGVSALHIDDYGLPYKCTFIPPHEMGLEDMDATAAKVRALVGERKSDDFMVIARPGSFGATTLTSDTDRREDWLRRALAYQEAGADAIFALCPTISLAKYFRSVIKGSLMTIRTLGTQGNPSGWAYDDDMMDLSITDLYDLGYDLYIEPSTLLGVAANAMLDAAREINRTGYSNMAASQHGNLTDLLRRWGDFDEVLRIHEGYVTGARPTRTPASQSER